MKNKRRRWIAAAIVILAVVAWYAKPAWVAYQIHQAKNALANGRPQIAIDRLEMALEHDADNADLHFWLARALRHAGRFDAITRQLQLAKDNGTDVHTLQREQWLVLAQSGRLREVERHLPGLLQSPGDDGSEICQAFCYGYLLNLRTNEALTLIDVWQKDFPQDPRPHFMRGLTMQMLSRFPEAAEAFREGLNLAPDWPKMRTRLGEILAELREFEEAADVYGQSLQSNPNDLEAQIGCARCLHNLGKTDQARVLVRRACDAFPECFDGLALLGEIDLASRRFESAAAALQTAFDQRPKDVAVRYGLAQALQGLGKDAEAAEHFEYVSIAQKELAISGNKIHEALQRPDDSQVRAEIGEILMQYGDPTDAARWLRAAVEIDWSNRRAHELLEEHFEATGDTDAAARHRQAARTGDDS